MLDFCSLRCIYILCGTVATHSQSGECFSCRSPGRKEGWQQGNGSKMSCHYHAPYRFIKRAGDEDSRVVGQRNKEDYQGLQRVWPRWSCCKETDRTNSSYYR